MWNMIETKEFLCFIRDKVCEYLNYDASNLKIFANDKSTEHREVRYIISYFCFHYAHIDGLYYDENMFTKCTLKDICKVVNKKTHGSLLNGLKQLDDLMYSEKHFKTQIEAIKCFIDISIGKYFEAEILTENRLYRLCKYTQRDTYFLVGKKEKVIRLLPKEELVNIIKLCKNITL